MPKKLHGRQIRQYQVGFAAAGVFRLGIGKCGKQQAQEGRHGLVLPLQECLSAFLMALAIFCISDVALVCATTWRAKKKATKSEQSAHGRKEVHPVLCCHKSSDGNFFDCRFSGSPMIATQRPSVSHPAGK